MNKNLKSNTFSGILWNLFEKIFVQGGSFVINIVLARLLSPDDYGIIGMLTIFIALSQIFIDSGFSRALVQKQNRSETDFSTVFFFNILISAFIYIILFITAPLIAEFYRVPILLQLMRVLFLVIIFNSLIVVQNARLMIEMNFKKIAQVNFVSVIISGIISIIAAYNNFGVWSLVIQSIARSIINAALFWILGRWHPKQRISTQSFGELFQFSSKLLLSGLLATIESNINAIVIGKLYQQRQLGFYTRARQFGELTSGTITSVLQTTTFPLLASLQNDRSKMVEIYSRLLKITALFVFPAMTGLALLSKQIIVLLLTDRWLPSAELLFWTAFTFLFTPLSALNMNILNAIGRSDLFLKLDISKIPLVVIIMLITFPRGIKAVVIGQFILSFICFFINAYLPGKLFGYGALRQIKDAMKIIIATSIMAIFLLLLNYLKSDLFILVSGVLAGGLIYVFCLILLKEKEIHALISMMKNRTS
jgi:O-antigen/teichoic acid export membrane protein